jgi:peptide/nickel transport system substrate-binding protein
VISRVLILATLLAVVGCSSAAPSQAPSGASGSDQTTAARTTPKVLNMVGREGTIGDFPGVEGRAGGTGEFVHDYLVVQDARDAWVGRVAEQISVDKGTWKLNPDGTMDTIWKLRPNVKWHDGTPFTAHDLMFSFTTYKDPELPSRYGEALKLMQSAEVVDPQTFVVHWTGPYASANQAPALNPMPKHLLESLYLNDKANFGQSTRFNREFVGLGPYKMIKWESGSHIEFQRFDDYFLGRPPLDGVVVRFITDPNTIVANLLAGTVDVMFHKDFDIESAVEVQRRWQGTNNQVKFVPSARVISVEIQYRKEYARPTVGLTERNVRHALLHAVDRQSLVEAVTHGISTVADSWIPPNQEYAPLVEGVTPKYPYDVNRAQQLLTQTGWTNRGSDGILVHAANGERFEFDLWNRFALERDQAILADAWKSIGVQANIRELPKARDRELEATLNGGQMMDQTLTDYTYNGRVATSDIATSGNRWTGRNLGGYSNPRVDELINRLRVTIDDRETANIQRDIVREVFTDLALLPLYFQMTPLLMREGITGPEGGTSTIWNFYQWDKR